MVPVRQWPLWVRYVIALSVAAVLFVGLIIYVHDHQAQSEGLPASPNRAEAAALQHEDRNLVAEQQAPHVVRVAAGVPATAASAAITAYMRDQVNRNLIAGPLDGKAGCQSRATSSGRQIFRCRITAGKDATVLNYPFDAAVKSGQVTFCQVVTSPDYQVPSPPVSARCR